MSEGSFKDFFSLQAADYARYRPRYPDALFTFLAGACAGHELAWDCGTGNGQAAVALAPHFARVVATDPSEGQIALAEPHPKVAYKKATAEESELEAKSVSLITVAQALHWFRQEEFFRECRRVAKPGGLLGFWCYELAVISPEVDSIVLELYKDVLGPYWDPARKLVEEGYRNVIVPFEELQAPAFSMQVNWAIAELLGYLGTWSALVKFRKEQGVDPRIALIPRLQAAWGDPNESKLIAWPLGLRVFRIE